MKKRQREVKDARDIRIHTALVRELLTRGWGIEEYSYPQISFRSVILRKRSSNQRRKDIGAKAFLCVLEFFSLAHNSTNLKSNGDIQ